MPRGLKLIPRKSRFFLPNAPMRMMIIGNKHYIFFWRRKHITFTTRQPIPLKY